MATLAPARSLPGLAAAGARVRASRRASVGWLLVAPSLGFLVLFVYWPILASLWLSVHRWDFLAAERPFVGFANYRDLLASADLANSLARTFLFVLLSIPPRLGLAFLLAQALLRDTPLHRLARGILFAPQVTSAVAVAIVWSWLLNSDVGLVNALLEAVGGPPVPWLTSTEWALVALVIVNSWKQLGYDTVLLTAGLAAVPRGCLEAAAVDGAGPWRRALHVTLPLLAPTLLFVLVVSVIDSFQLFTLVSVMTRGGPAWSTDLLVHLLYRTSFVYFDIGRGSALAVLLLLFLLGLTWLQMRTLGRRVHYGDEG